MPDRPTGVRCRARGPMLCTRIALAIAGLGSLSLAAGCSVPRPVPAVGSPTCALVRVPLTIDLTSGGIGPAGARANPLTQVLRNAAEARLTRVGPADAGDDVRITSHLVVSGGGQHGAFGTGFLAGLDPLPDYDVVTGVSTGALQAPLAMLGNEAPPEDRRFDPADDFPAGANRPGRREIDDLVSAYMITRQATLYRSRGVTSVIRRATLGDLEPLRVRVGTLVTDQTLRRLATLNRGNKALFVLILNWDTGVAEQIDMLDLARRYAGGEAHARNCFIDVLIAASSEPLGAPPVPIDDHLYVDAGLRFGVFAREAARAGADAARRASALRPAAAGTRVRGPLVRTDMIRNGGIAVRPDSPQRYSALDVMGRGRTILVNQVYAFSMRNILDLAEGDHQVRFAFITQEETDAGPPATGVEFDPHYMARMIEIGRARGHQGRWNLVSPGAVSQ